jgi:arylformamidase
MQKLVWLNLDQAALDYAYDQRNFAPNMESVLARFASRSHEVRASVGMPSRYSYGNLPSEKLDFYRSRKLNASNSSNSLSTPTQIFIHGGAWRSGFAADYGFLAEAFCNNGANLAIIDFDNVLEADNGLAGMVHQVRKAIAWIYKNAKILNTDPRDLHIFGHSSGAHLAATTLANDWQSKYAVPTDVIRSAICCSGIYELAPVRLSSRNEYMHLTEPQEHTFSPQRYVESITTPVMIIHGSLESPEFIRQAISFSDAIKTHSIASDLTHLIEVKNQNHFEILETIANPSSDVFQQILAHMKT